MPTNVTCYMLILMAMHLFMHCMLILMCYPILLWQDQMETKLAAPVPDGEAPKSDVEVVAEVLTKKSSFLKNVGLHSSSTNKSSKANAAVASHVHDLEEKLERSRHQTEAMREEMAAMRKKAEESEAAQALLLKRAEENDARYAQLLALLSGKPTEN